MQQQNQHKSKYQLVDIVNVNQWRSRDISLSVPQKFNLKKQQF